MVNDIIDCECNFNEDNRCDTFSRQRYPYLKSQLNKEDIDWLATIPECISLAYADKKIIIIHGSYFKTSEFIFNQPIRKLNIKIFDALKTNVILARHCGILFLHKNMGKI